MSTCRHPFDIENHPAEIVTIRSGTLSKKDINVDKCVEIGSEQIEQYHQTLPEEFYDPLSKFLNILQKSVQVNDEEIIDTSLIYSRVIALQLTNAAMTVEKVFKHELTPIPTSIFNDDGDLRHSDIL